MLQKDLYCTNHDDAQGNPAGGYATAEGLTIRWQNGPIPKGEEPNGAFVETVIKAALQRIEYYQKSKFACVYNADAIAFLEQALERLEDRTRDRVRRNVEGSHKV